MHNKAIYTALFLISILTSSYALSGSGHHHGMEQAPPPGAFVGANFTGNFEGI